MSRIGVGDRSRGDSVDRDSLASELFNPPKITSLASHISLSISHPLFPGDELYEREGEIERRTSVAIEPVKYSCAALLAPYRDKPGRLSIRVTMDPMLTILPPLGMNLAAAWVGYRVLNVLSTKADCTSSGVSSFRYFPWAVPWPALLTTTNQIHQTSESVSALCR